LNRQEAWEIVTEFIKNPNLRSHMLAVEAGMRAYARRFGEDEEQWAVVGLLHDFDWEIHPQLPEHPIEGARILRQRGVPEDLVQSVLSHADFTGVPRTRLREKALFAIDELTGLITAVALVRPNKSLLDVDVKSIKKKWKDKAFARGANREDIERGTAELGIPLEEHIQVVLEAMKEIATELGLQGDR